MGLSVKQRTARQEGKEESLPKGEDHWGKRSEEEGARVFKKGSQHTSTHTCTHTPDIQLPSPFKPKFPTIHGHLKISPRIL